MMRAQKAFTLVELLVVISIIGILISLMLPAVQSARESARRTQCRNNLKQIGLAFLNFESENKNFPPGYRSAVGPGGLDNDQGPGWGWAASILPYLEYGSLHSQINFNKDITDPINANARVSSVSVYLCPSDGGPTTFAVDGLGSGGNPVLVARSNYVGVFGQPEITPDPGFLSNDPDRALPCRGMLYRNVSVRIADVTDGTSHTLLVGERSSRLACATWTGAVTGGQVPPRSPNPYNYGPEGAPVLILGHTGSAADVPPHTPNSTVSHVDDFWSNHPQGVNFLFVDGSVRDINDTINPEVWWALGTRAGGETTNLGE